MRLFARRDWLLLVALAGLLGWVGPAEAVGQVEGGEGRFSVDLIPAVGVPVGAFAARSPGLGARAGAGLGLGVAARIHRGIGVYGSARYTRFRCGDCPSFGLRSALDDLGFETGGEFHLPVRRAHPWVRAGVVGHQLQLRDDNDEEAASRLGWGIGLAVGADYRLGRHLALVPALGFTNYSAVFPLATFSDQDTPVRYLAATLGLRYRF